MVTTAQVVFHESVKRRTFSSRFVLWCIPLISWGLLTVVFILSTKQSDMVTLLISENRVLLENVQNYLQEENVPFVIEENAIAIHSHEKERILRELSRQEWFEPDTGRNRGVSVSQDPSEFAPYSFSNLARQDHAGEGS